MDGENRLTSDSVKDQVAEQVRKWLDNPGAAESLTIEILDMPIPPQQGGGTMRIFALSTKNVVGSARMRLSEAPRIVPAGVMPPGKIG